MALLDRVKERVDSDLSNDELTAMIAEATDEIERRHGQAAEELVLTVDGDVGVLQLPRPLGTELTVREDATGYDEFVELDPDDYVSLNGGRLLRRSKRGPSPRSKWGARVEISYTAYDDTKQREEVVIKLIELAVSHQAGVTRESIDSYSTSFSADYVEAREKLLNSLSGSKVLLR